MEKSGRVEPPDHEIEGNDVGDELDTESDSASRNKRTWKRCSPLGVEIATQSGQFDELSVCV